MKRLASHRVFFAEQGFCTLGIVSIDDEGRLQAIEAFEAEQPAVEWHPGVLLITTCRVSTLEEIIPLLLHRSLPATTESVKAWKGSRIFVYLLYPFDFTTMRPDAETRHKLLLWP